MIAANAPDVDAFSYARGEYFALAFRRGITHGVPAQVVLPFVVAGAVLAWDRWVRRCRDPEAVAARPREILLLSVLGVLTHPALDWMNVYGMRWGLPFVASWSYGDALFILDPWLWLILGGAVCLAGAGGRWLWGVLGALTTLLMVLGPVPAVASALWVAGVASVGVLRRAGWPREGAPRRRVAASAVAVALSYIGAMMAGNALGSRRTLAAAVAAGLEPSEVMLSPSAANPFTSEVEVATPAGYVPGEYRWLPSPRVVLRPKDGVPLLRRPPEADPQAVEGVLRAARDIPDVRHYLVWSRYPYATVSRDRDAWVVRYSDARYDDRAGAGGLGGVTVRVPAVPVKPLLHPHSPYQRPAYSGLKSGASVVSSQARCSRLIWRTWMRS